jgi:putative CocE/NonD family hydrolase
MRKFLIALLWVALCLPGHAQDSVWVREHYVKKEVYIPMRDGIKLFTSIYYPVDSTGSAHPILMARTPYSCAPYGPGNFSPRLYRGYWIKYLKEGYILVLQDVRGAWMSEGTFEDIRPYDPARKKPDEASDTYDAIDWLVKHVPGNNGRVGVFGISYPGFYATMAALSGHPALKAVSPQAPVTDWFQGDDIHHNGALCLMDTYDFYSAFGVPRPVPTMVRTSKFHFESQDNYNLFLTAGAIPHLTAMLGDSIAFWKDIIAHPNDDAFWKARNDRQYLTDVKPAMLVVGGLFDAEDCFGALNVYKTLAAHHGAGFVFGPWYHGQWSSPGGGWFLGNVRWGSNTSEYYQDSIEIPFFQYYLNGKGSYEPRASVFFTGENAWHEFPSWPPAAQSTSLYLAPSGGLSFDPPPVSGGFSSYVSDPAKPVPYTSDVHFQRTREYMDDDQRFAARRPDVLVFETPPLTAALTLAGPVVADLQTSISTTDADFVVKLIDVFPDDFSYDPSVRGNGKPYPMGGYEMLVRGDVMRGRYRTGFSTPTAFTPGVPTEVRYTLNDVAHTFKKGHRIMVQVQSTWFPLIDRNPQQFVDIYHASDKDFVPSTIHIYHDAQHPSRIILPVLQ